RGGGGGVGARAVAGRARPGPALPPRPGLPQARPGHGRGARVRRGAAPAGGGAGRGEAAGPVSEGELEAELDRTRIAEVGHTPRAAYRRLRDRLPRVGHADAGGDVPELGVIEHVERLQAELGADAAVVEVLEERGVPVVHSRAAQEVPRRVAELAVRRTREDERVEPAVPGLLLGVDRPAEVVAADGGGGAVAARQRAGVSVAGDVVGAAAPEARDAGDLPAAQEEPSEGARSPEARQLVDVVDGQHVRAVLL